MDALTNILLIPQLSGEDVDENTKRSLLKAHNSALVELVKNISCPICQDVPTQPYMLPLCGHSFCYSCIKYWFQCNPSCPVCRMAIGENKPVVNHSLKRVIDLTLEKFKHLEEMVVHDQEEIDKNLDAWYREKNEEFESDKASDFPWLKKIASNWGRAVVDDEDGVPRCSACHWELIDGHCENCGRQMVGWQSRTDGDELDDDIDEDDEDEDEDLVGPSMNVRESLNSEDEDWNEYDNGLRDMRGSVVQIEAEESEEDETDTPRSHSQKDDPYAFNSYESDDGFVVDDDDDEEEDIADEELDDSEDNNEYLNTSDVEIVDEGMVSGDEDIIRRGRSNRGAIDFDSQSEENEFDEKLITKRRKPVVLNSDDSEHDSIDLSHDSDDDFVKTLKEGRNKKVEDSDSTEDGNYEEDDLIVDLSTKKHNHSNEGKKRKHNNKRKPKHKHHKHKKSKNS